MTNKQVFEIIKKAKRIALFAHTRPDPDAFGALFALKRMLQNMGKDAEIFAVRTKKSVLDDLFPLDEVKTDFVAKDFDLVVLVDLRILSRVDEIFLEELEKATNLVNIDHHEGEGLITEASIIDSKAAATCQLLTHFMLDNKLEITPEIATYLWTGLMGDTDRFLHNNLSKDVLDVAGVLFESGADAQKVYDSLYRHMTFLDYKVREKFHKNTKYLEGGKVGVTVFSLKEMNRLGIDKNMLDKFVNESIQTEGVEASFVCVEIASTNFKVSVRSRLLNCKGFAEKFGGGGHICASGFGVIGTKKQVCRMTKDWAKEILQNG